VRPSESELTSTACATRCIHPGIAAEGRFAYFRPTSPESGEKGLLRPLRGSLGFHLTDVRNFLIEISSTHYPRRNLK
jgi:hypothetical protein